MPDACSITPDSTGGPITGHPLGPEWVTSPGLTPYPDALAAMQARVAAIRAGTAPEQVWLVEHPPLYTAGTSAQAGRPGRSRTFSGVPGRARGAMDLSRPGPARGLRHARSVAAARQRAGLRRALLCARAGGVADRGAGAAGCARGAPRGAHGDLGRDARRRVQDRRDRCAYQPLGELAWRGSERGAGPGAFRRHRAVRDFGAWRDQPRGVGPGGQHGSG